MPAPHISANRLPALVGNLSLALAELEAKTADQRTKGGHAGGHDRGVTGLGKPGAGLPGATVGPAMLPAVMTLTGALSLTLALAGALLLTLRAQLPITLLISLAQALREFRGGVTGDRERWTVPPTKTSVVPGPTAVTLSRYWTRSGSTLATWAYSPAPSRAGFKT